MKKIILNLIFMFLLSSIFVACSKDKEDGKNDSASDIALSLTKDTLLFKAEGGTLSFKVLSLSAWSVDVPSDAWFEISKTSGTGDNMLTVQVKDRSLEGREQKITFVSGDYSYDLYIIQPKSEGLYYNLEVTPQLQTVDAGETVAKFTIKSDAPKITITNDNDWVVFESLEIAGGNQTLEAKVKANTDGEIGKTRAAYIYFEAEGAKKVRVVVNQNPSKFFPSFITNTKADDNSGMKTSKEIAALMGLGWNVGNTYEATWSGARPINQEVIKAVKQAGFNHIRIPAAWNYNSDQNSGKINPDFMNKIKTVVDYAIEEGLYIMLNCHWDGGWLEDNLHLNDKMPKVLETQRVIWEQVAMTFRDYDDHLMFASCNEPGMNNGMGSSACENLRKCHQVFVDAIRSTGGKNAYRTLIFQGPTADINKTVSFGTKFFPTDKEGYGYKYLMLEDHCYDPSDFTIMESDGAWSEYIKIYWGEYKQNDKRHAGMSASDLNNVMAKFKSNYGSLLPLVIGEFSAHLYTDNKLISDIDLDAHYNSVVRWSYDMVKAMKDNNIVPCYWDNSGLNSGNSALFNRSNGEIPANRQLIIDEMLNALNGKSFGTK